MLKKKGKHEGNVWFLFYYYYFVPENIEKKHYIQKTKKLFREHQNGVRAGLVHVYKIVVENSF